MGRLPGPAELAGTALFPASDDIAHITGGHRVADGGDNTVGAGPVGVVAVPDGVRWAGRSLLGD